MKLGTCITLLAFCTVAVAADEDNDGSQPKIYSAAANEVNDGSQPKIYSDISPKAQEDAMKYGGFKLLAGLCYSMSSFEASIPGGSCNTKKDFSAFRIAFGVSGSKVFRKKFLGGLSLTVDMFGSKTKNDGWNGLNADYSNLRGPIYRSYGNLNGSLKVPSINLEFATQFAYIFKKYASYAFLKLGLAREEGTYCYKAGAVEIGKVKAIGLVPLIGVGGGKNLNQKFGVMFEINLPVRKKVKKNFDSVEQEIKLGRKTIRLLGTYAAKLSF